MLRLPDWSPIMKYTSLIPLVALTAAIPLSAQITFRSVNDAGFAYVDKANKLAVKNYAANTNFIKSVGLYAYPKGGYMNAKFRRTPWNGYVIENTCRLVRSYGFKSGRTTGDTKGTAGAQKYELAITTKKQNLNDVQIEGIVFFAE